jgi:hypothetical protein
LTRQLRSPLRNPEALGAGLNERILREGAKEAYRLLDTLDETLLSSHKVRLSEIVELANLSSIIGNLLALGIVKKSGGVFDRAGAHKYQDLRASPKHPGASNVEIKIALGTNRPKGHLAKEGYYLTCRYVLADEEGRSGAEGPVVWIWELRFGHLKKDHFALSNTPGDSGKTAVVNTEGMKRLRLVYFDEQLCPYARIERYLTEYGA